MSTDLEVFSFPTTGQQIRTTVRDGEPWFVAADICGALEIGNPSQALSYLDDDERGETLISNEGTPGSPRRAIVSEAGLYSLILRSRKPEAKAFKRWVTHEVLPSIRKTGSYERPLTDLERARQYVAALEKVEHQAREIEAKDAALAIAELAADAWNVLASAEGDYSAREAAFILNRDPAIDTGQNRLISTLRSLGMTDRAGTPYAKHATHLTLRATTWEDPETGRQHLKTQIRVTPDGVRYVHRKLGGVRPVAFAALLREVETRAS